MYVDEWSRISHRAVVIVCPYTYNTMIIVFVCISSLESNLMCHTVETGSLKE